jgi:peptidyl-tRNA hydrolase, PTH1 family
MSRLGRLFGRLRLPRRAAVLPETPQWMIAGLGNPGAQYSQSRHNLGFMVLERLAAACGGSFSEKKKFRGVWTLAKLAGKSILLLKPMTYYNLSGECVASAAQFLRIPIERLIVIHDDLDLQPGAVRIKIGGGDAGNLGVRSVAECISASDFIRVRIGTGRPPLEDDVKDFILRPMNEIELEFFEGAIRRAAQAVETIVEEGAARAMNKHNRRDQVSGT